MKYIKTFETMIEGSFNYKYNIDDIVKLIHRDQDRTFKVIDRKNRMSINMYSVETIDDYLDEEHFELSKWPVRMWEYQSKIRNLSPEELKQYNLEQDIIKFNL